MSRKKKENVTAVINSDQVTVVNSSNVSENLTSPPKISLTVLNTTEPTTNKVSKPKKVFKYERLSASMAKTFLQCKRKFFSQYIEGITSDQNDSFSLGTAVHKALEEANKSLKDSPRQLNVFEIEEYVTVFRDTLARLPVKDTSLFLEGENLVKSELSSYNLEEEIIGIEQVFDLVTPEGVRIYGFMDKVVKIGDSALKVIDYKTSLNPLSFDEAKKDLQLSMYDLAINMLYPEYETVILELRYLRPGDQVTSTRSKIERDSFRKTLYSIDSAIKEFMEQTKESPDGTLNEFCSWCSYKNACPKYVETANTLLPDAPQPYEIDDNRFITMWDKVSQIAKAADAWKDSLKVWAAQRLEAAPDIGITNGSKEVYSLSTTRREYDIEAVAKVIPLDDLLGASTGGNPLIKIKNKELEEYLKRKGNKKIQAKVDDATQVKFNSPQFRIRKV